MRHPFAAKPREPLSSTCARNDSQLYLGLPEPRRSAGDTHRASERQFAATAKRKTIYRGNRWLPHDLQAAHDALSEKRESLPFGGSSLRQLVNVCASDK